MYQRDCFISSFSSQNILFFQNPLFPLYLYFVVCSPFAQKQCVLLKDMSSLMFGDYMNPDGDADERVYEEVCKPKFLSLSEFSTSTYSLKVIVLLLSTHHCFSQVKSLKKMYDVVEQCLEEYNNTHKNRMNLVIFR